MTEVKQLIINKIASKVPLTVEDMKNIAVEPSLQSKFIIDDLFIENGRCIIYGKPKRGKSNLALFFSMLLSEKKEIFGRKTKRQSILYITTEQTAVALSDRVAKMAVSLNVKKGFILYYLEPKERNIKRIEELVKQYKTDLVVIDCLYNLIGQTNDQKVIHTWLGYFDSLINEHNISIIVVHHRRKQGQRLQGGEQLDDITDEIMGSGFFGMWSNLIIGIAKEDFSKDVIQVGFASRDSKKGMEDINLFWNREKCVYEDVPKEEEVIRPNLDAIYRTEIVKWLKDNISSYKNTSQLVEAARDRFDNRRGWRGLSKYWDCWNTARNEEEFDAYFESVEESKAKAQKKVK